MPRLRPLAILPLLASLALAACQSDASPPAVGERVGNSLDHASVATGDALGRAGEATGHALNRAGDSVSRATQP